MFFDGSFKSKRTVSLGGASSKAVSKAALVEDKRAARVAREQDVRRQKAALRIQAFYRSRKEARHVRDEFRTQWDGIATLFPSSDFFLKSATELHVAMRHIASFASATRVDDVQRLAVFAAVVVRSVKRPDFHGFGGGDLSAFSVALRRFLALCVDAARVVLRSGGDGNIAEPLLGPVVELTSERFWARNGPSFAPQQTHYHEAILAHVVSAGLFETLGLLLSRVQSATGTASALTAVELALRLLDRRDPDSLASFVLNVIGLPSLGSLPPAALDHLRSHVPVSEMLAALDGRVPPTFSQKGSAQGVALLGNLAAIVRDVTELVSPGSCASAARVFRGLSRSLPRDALRRAGQLSPDDADEDLDDPMDGSTGSYESIDRDGWARAVSIASPRLLRVLWQNVDSSPLPSNADVSAVAALFVTVMTAFPSAREDVLNVVAFNTRMMRHLWRSAVESGALESLGKGRRDALSVQGAALVTLFSAAYAHQLKTVDDSELFAEGGRGALFSKDELVVVVDALLQVAVTLFLVSNPDDADDLAADDCELLLAARHETSSLLWDLRERDIRMHFCPPRHWNHPSAVVRPDELPLNLLMAEDDEAESGGGHADHARPVAPTTRRPQRPTAASGNAVAVRSVALLRELPFVVPFEDRVRILQLLIDKAKSQSGRDLFAFVIPKLRAKVRRPFLYEDGFAQLNQSGAVLRGRVQIQLIDANGLEEAGVDGGGLFKEFLTDFVKRAFDPSLGFFAQTEENYLYPNPHAQSLHEDVLSHFEFIGRMVGKAILERILVELPLASFFLSKIRHRPTHIADLASLDKELHRQLMYVRNYTGDFADLALTFSIGVERPGQAPVVVDLIPNGRNVDVTRQNRLQYVFLVANYRLNVSIRAQSAAFMRGLTDVIDANWLGLFDEEELRMIISGSETGVDVEDMRRHTHYGNGFKDDHPTIAMFWRVVAGFSREQKRKLLKFATSCSRPPLLGFRELYPPFMIQNAGSASEGRLPTASTCMNILKLPQFEDERTLRKKLLYSIESGAGFDLS